jgi:1,2-diacylglycerol 3-beta-glucosyltransferase
MAIEIHVWVNLLRLVRLIMNATQLWLGLSVAYLLTLLVAAVSNRGPRVEGSDAPDAERPIVVVLVAAHDEESCVADAVGSLERQQYPVDRLETIVVADNCSDSTAARAAEAGATVWQRTDPRVRGKGPALRWALERVWRERPDVDVIAFVDADCLASKNFVDSVASAIRGGREAVQVGYVVSNSDDSAEAALRAAGFYLINDIRPRGKSALGLSCGLLGTGMAFDAQLLRDIPWDSYSVTEDVEFHLTLLEAGKAVGFVRDARVVSPMPTTARSARSQQIRWESGNATMARTVAPRLLLMALRRRDLQLVHGALERFVPAQSVVVAGVVALGVRRGRWGRAARMTAAGQVTYVVGGLLAAHAPPAVWRALPRAPGLVFRKLGIIGGSALGRTVGDWVRTDREAK